MDITARLERIPVGGFHYRLLTLAGLGWMFDAMDTGIVAFVLPVLMKEWGLSTAQVGYIGSAGLLGMAVGAVLSGWAADKFGRKNVFATTVLTYSIATGLCALASSYWTLLALRFLVGFGLGGELPVAATLVSEYCPPSQRGKFVVLLESFWGVGWLLASIISYLVIPYYGWQISFVIGAIPAFYVFVIRMSAPESVRYLIDTGRTEEAYAIISDIERSVGLQPVAGTITDVPTANQEPKFAVLWSGAYLRRTVLLWLLWFGVVYSYYGIFTWLPSLLVGQGLTIVRTFEYVLIMTLAQLPGYFSAAYLVDRVGRKATLSLYLAASAVCAYFFGQGGSPTAVIIWGSLMSFFNLGAWGVVYTYTPELYPTRIRAFGSGWASAVGRFGGILAPTVVGYMIAEAGGFARVFDMFTAVMLGVALVVLVMGEETKGKALEEISK